MPMIKCPECGKKISDQCEVCIHCGARIKPKKHPMLITLLIIFVLLYACKEIGRSTNSSKDIESSNQSTKPWILDKCLENDFENAEWRRKYDRASFCHCITALLTTPELSNKRASAEIIEKAMSGAAITCLKIQHGSVSHERGKEIFVESLK